MKIAFVVVILASTAVAFAGKCEDAVPECVRKLENGERCDPLPVPDRLLETIPQIPDVGYKIQKLRNMVYMVTDGFFIAMVIKTPRQLVVIDAPENFFVVRDPNTGAVIGNLMTNAIEDIAGDLNPKIVRFIYTHQHFDHIGGARIVYDYLKKTYPKADLKAMAHESILKRLASAQSKRAPLPEVVIIRSRSLRLTKNLKVNLIPTDGGHSDSDLLVHIPPKAGMPGIAMLVDIAFPGWITPFGIGLVNDINEYIDQHERLLALDWEIYIGGHLGQPGNRADIEISEEYIRDMVDIAAQSLALGLGQPIPELQEAFDPTSPNFGNQMRAIQGVFGMEGIFVGICEALLVEKWGCRLGGVDIFSREHCFAAVTFQRLDN
ncbi:hypothetical protein NDN08_001364 [Rhodosorus marinus]|uniref:Metallo-beta-lactamase domain-containing protein n=1 Tax=Rhodosorus marinus TaxID=101924 RepID=A0AAV8UQK3_9RHOD|nr:hypothetical protein NDN08_001363 [Rhodosorus marinus]KAJ8904850.1 hypothetical protein NDN08_001364 [Rhodosorus marinus]